jgi:glycine/D-amino acid oxidase-like deaminating enzyme
VAAVAIIGGGFCGLSAALHLAEAGIEAVVLEAEAPGWGASGRNGGQVIAGLKLDPRECVAKFGEAHGLALHRFGTPKASCGVAAAPRRRPIAPRSFVGFGYDWFELGTLLVRWEG